MVTLAHSSADAYIHALKEFAKYYHRPPDQLGPKEISQFQLHLLRDRKLSAQTVKQHIAALRFFFNLTLKRRYPPSDFRYPKTPQRLPVILSQEEVRAMIDAATSLLHRTLLMTLYSTGMRGAEITRLKVNDIDSRRIAGHSNKERAAKTVTSPSAQSFWRRFMNTGAGRNPWNICFQVRRNGIERGPPDPQGGVLRLQRGCPQSRHSEKSRPSYAETLVCYSYVGIRRRPAHDSTSA